MTTKVCSKCKEKKALTEFHKSKNSIDGVRPNCKLCGCKISSEYYKINREKEIKRISKYSKENREKINKRRVEYRKNNKERFKKYNHTYTENNKEKITSKNKIYYKNNIGILKEKYAIFYKKNYNKIKDRELRNVKSLSDSYVRRKLRLKKDQATPELIELKRTHLQITRYLKEAKN